jgi:DNA-3-methyladenine glycosylase II
VNGSIPLDGSLRGLLHCRNHGATLRSGLSPLNRAPIVALSRSTFRANTRSTSPDAPSLQSLARRSAAASRRRPLGQHPRPTPYHLRMPRPRTGPTRKPPYDPAVAIAALSAADPRLARLIARAGPFTLRLPAQQSPFEALAQSIVYQQLHGKAAATIHQRLLEGFAPICGLDGHGRPLHFSPQHLLDCPNAQLRAAGLSKNKSLALRDLAVRALGDPDREGNLPTIKQIKSMPDDEIIRRLTQVRGIGRWTAEMFLMFRLGRPNVLPTSDYGVRKGFALTYLKLDPATKVTPDLLATPAQLERRAKKWQPWCSVASWYMWRACDLAQKG